MSGLAISKCAPTSIEKLFQGEIPPRPDIVEGINIYQWLSREPITPYVTQTDDNVRQFWVLGPQVNGLGLNASLYFVAPDKSDGFDTFDLTKGDWTDLYANRKHPLMEAERQKRLERHRRIPGWSFYEKNKDRYHQSLIRDKGKTHPKSYRSSSENIVMLPAWQTDVSDATNPKRYWLLEQSELKDAVIRKIRWDSNNEPSNPDLYDQALGVLFMAIWSAPSWSTRLNYNGDTLGGQFMKPTQTLPLTLWKSAELFSADIFSRIEKHCEQNP